MSRMPNKVLVGSIGLDVRMCSAPLALCSAAGCNASWTASRVPAGFGSAQYPMLRESPSEAGPQRRNPSDVRISDSVLRKVSRPELHFGELDSEEARVLRRFLCGSQAGEIHRSDSKYACRPRRRPTRLHDARPRAIDKAYETAMIQRRADLSRDSVKTWVRSGFLPRADLARWASPRPFPDVDASLAQIMARMRCPARPCRTWRWVSTFATDLARSI